MIILQFWQKDWKQTKILGSTKNPKHTCTSNVKYFFKFLMIITKNGSLIPSVFFGSAGHVMYVVLKQDNIWVKYHYLLLNMWPFHHDRKGCLKAIQNYPYLTFVPTISKTRDWMSLSVIRLMWPFRTWNKV